MFSKLQLLNACSETLITLLSINVLILPFSKVCLLIICSLNIISFELIFENIPSP